MSAPEQRFKRPESVLVVVYTRAGKVLLLRRADHPEFWQSVTGSMEWGDEQPAETAARELREETGITAPPAAFTDWKLQNRYEIFPQWRYKYEPGVSENTEHFFSFELADEQPVTLSPGEHSEYAWVPFAEAAERVFSWTNRDALLLLMKERAAHWPRCVPDSGARMENQESVVLVNGLWLADPALWLLARHLRHAGFRVHTFSYPSVRHDLRTNAARLDEFLAGVPGATVHLVGYSLGGLIIRALFHFQPRQRPGRIVLLGSPQTGNRAAQTLARARFGRALLGRAVAELIAGTPQKWNWPARETGVIAGSRSVGLGRLVARLAVPNDGSVAVEETLVSGAHARLVLPVAHFAMLLAPAVARQVAWFLRYGTFEPPQ